MNPVIFQTSIFTLYTLWIFIAVAILATTYSISKLSTKKGLKLQFLSDNSWMIFFYGLIGARVIAIISNLNIYFHEFSFSAFFNLFAIWDKGLSVWGALIGACLYLYKICKEKEDQDFFKWLDVIVPSVILGLAISHIGAFFDGMSYGRETGLPWGVNFENSAIKYAVPIHPTQIYAFLYATAIYIVSQMTNFEKTGYTSIGAIGIYAFFRLLEEFVRGDDTWMVGFIRLPQIFAFLVFVASIVVLYKRRPKGSTELPNHDKK